MRLPLPFLILASLIAASLAGCASNVNARDTTAASHPSGKAARNLATVEAYYAAAEARDIDAFERLWADDGQFLVPWLPSLAIKGKAAIRASFAGRLKGMTKIAATREIAPLAGGDQVFVRAAMSFQYTNGKSYSNTFVALFTLNDEGKIAKMEEWPDLETMRQTFGALPGR